MNSEILVEGTNKEYEIKLATNFCGLYYKNIFTIVSDDRQWSLYYRFASP
jgi:hypothetical protein